MANDTPPSDLISSPSAAGGPPSDLVAAPTKTAAKEDKGGEFGWLYPYYYGLGTGLVGLPGETERFLGRQVPESIAKTFNLKTQMPPEQPNETVFPTVSEVQSTLTKMGVPRPSKEYGAAEMLGELAPGIAGLGKGAVDVASNLKSYLGKGKAARELAEALKTRIGGRVSDIITGKTEEAAKGQQALESTQRAQEQLAGRGKVAKQRQAARDATVEASLGKISPNQNVLAEDVGSVIQNAGRDNITKLRESREQQAIVQNKDPAFKEARAREQRGDFISTNPKSEPIFNDVLKDVETQIERTPEPFRSELKKRFVAIRGEEIPLSEAELRVEQLKAATIPGYAARTTKIKPMTMDQAEFLRRMLKDKNLSKIEGFPALDANRMHSLGDRLAQAMDAYDSRFGQYIAKYRELSAPITEALAGRGRALTDEELQTEENVLFAADKRSAVRYYLDGSRERAERLLDLVGGKNPKVTQAVRDYMRLQLQDMTSAEAQRFIRNNRGLLQVFPELERPMNQVVSDKLVAETRGPEAAEKAKAAERRLTRQETEATKQKTVPEEKVREYRLLSEEIQRAAPADSMRMSRDVAKKMAREGFITPEQYGNYLTEVNDIEKLYGQSEASKKLMWTALRKLGLYSGYGVAGTLGYFGLKSTLGED